MSSQNLPHHLYVYVDSYFVRKHGQGFEPAVWFGLRAEYARAWGLHVMLECGAVYRNLPPHSVAFDKTPEADWTLRQAQVWDCYGPQHDVIRYDYLTGLSAKYDYGNQTAQYLFTSCPNSDGFSASPDQSKEFCFMRTDGHRLLIRPTNMLLFSEASFTEDSGWPTDIQTANTVWECEP